MRKMRNAFKFSVRKPERRDHFVDRSVGCRIDNIEHISTYPAFVMHFYLADN
jgi:hypothetical protein